MSSRLLLSTGLAAALLLSGCANQPTRVADPGFGEAVKYDTAIQTINPEPVYPPDAAQPGSNGDVAQQAMERYRKGQTKPVQTQQTTSGTTGSGSGSGGGPQ
jgi:hypothetical protein